MRYLISFNTEIIRQEQAPDWKIDKVLTLGDDVTPSNLSRLPQDEKESLVIFVPTVSNYGNSLSYEGANLGLRILLFYLRIGKTNVDIVLMGNESKDNFLLHYDYPNLLKIPGFDYIRFNKNIVASYDAPRRESIKLEEYKPYIDNLGLKLPSSFKSTHSLTNEWCLYKWNSFMGFSEDSSLPEESLYFDYLITLEKLNRVKSKTASDNLKERIKELPSSRILVIDDKKGWHKFFTNLFSDTHVDVRCIGEDFNKIEFDKVEDRIRNEIDSFKPEVIILDFRLMEDRDVDKDVKHTSGYEVLSKVIKKTDKTCEKPLESFGRQVFVFTATSRIENIFQLQKEGGADEFILKEKPENYNGKENTKAVISGMVSNLKTYIDRAKFLIPLNEKMNEILEVKGKTDTIVTDTIETVSQPVRQLIQRNSLDVDILKLVFLNLFSILESIKDNKGELSTYIKSEASRIGLSSEYISKWDNISTIRNCLAHGRKIIDKGDRDIKGKSISDDFLKEWINHLVIFITEFIKLYLK